MRIFALISALAAFVAAVAGAAVRVDTGCVLGIGLGGFESCIALSTGPPDIEIRHIGLIEVLDEKNERLGYISKNLYKDGQFTYDTSVGNALPVSFTTTGTGTSTRLNVGTTVRFDPSIILDFSSHRPWPLVHEHVISSRRPRSGL